MSLSALGNVISVLNANEKTMDKKPVPFRDNELTKALCPVMEKSKVLMFVNISPEGKDIEQSKNSLVFAKKARNPEK